MIGATSRRAWLWRIRSPTDSTKLIPSRILASCLVTEPLELGDLTRFARGPEVGQALDLERVVQLP